MPNLPWVTPLSIFPPPAGGEQLLYIADNPTQYANKRVSFEAEVFLPDITGQHFDDLTVFKGNNWNGWQTGEATTRATLEDSQCRVLQLMTFPEEKNAWTVIRKTLSGLKQAWHISFPSAPDALLVNTKRPPVINCGWYKNYPCHQSD